MCSKIHIEFMIVLRNKLNIVVLTSILVFVGYLYLSSNQQEASSIVEEPSQQLPKPTLSPPDQYDVWVVA
jgi:tryptophan-rich sensory protein